jgi:hypothetical protein
MPRGGRLEGSGWRISGKALHFAIGIAKSLFIRENKGRSTIVFH